MNVYYGQREPFPSLSWLLYVLLHVREAHATPLAH